MKWSLEVCAIILEEYPAKLLEVMEKAGQTSIPAIADGSVSLEGVPSLEPVAPAASTVEAVVSAGQALQQAWKGREYAIELEKV